MRIAMNICVALTLFGSFASFDAKAGQGFNFLKQDGSKFYYTGSVTVSGEYLLLTDPTTLELMGEVLCFYPKGESAKNIPRENGDRRTAWFCFEPQNEAREQLKIPDKPLPGSCGFEGEATIKISGYMADLAESSVNDESKLVRVISATSPKPVTLNCD